jgi:RimJ/RimL family protein N-acetyltransferase
MEIEVTKMALYIETERLILRNAKPEDAASLYSYRESEFVQRFNAMGSITSEQMDEQVIKDSTSDRAAYIELKETHRAIGAIWMEEDSLRHRANSICTSCWLGEEHSGKGYMTEAYRALISYLFAQRKADVVVARVFADNMASRRMMEKAGFVQEGILRHAVKGYKEKIFDDVLYSILRTEWER